MIRMIPYLLAMLVVTVTSVGGAGGEQQPSPAPPGKVIEEARLLVRQGKAVEARELLLNALPLAPDPTRLYLELGQVYEKLGNQAAALAAYKDGVRVHEQGRR